MPCYAVECDCDPEDRAVDLNEFLKVHNSLAMDQIDFDNVEFF